MGKSSSFLCVMQADAHVQFLLLKKNLERVYSFSFYSPLISYTPLGMF